MESSAQPRIKILALEVSDQYCKDILVTCVEGGSNYWAEFRNVVRDDELDILEVEVRAGDDEEAQWKKITIEDIRQGVNKVASDPKIKIHDSWRQMILSDDNDAGSSDLVLQAAVFGEIIYG